MLVFVAQLIFDKQYELTFKLALWPVDTPWFEPYQIFLTCSSFPVVYFPYCIEHAGTLHVWADTRKPLGTKRFCFYLACGVGAAVAHLVMQQMMGSIPAPAVGASGAIMGVLWHSLIFSPIQN